MTQSLGGSEEKQTNQDPAPLVCDPGEERYITGSGILPKELGV